MNNAKSIFYIFGLIIAVSAAGSMIIYGTDFVNGTPLLVGGVAIYLWRKEERNRRFIKSEVNLMESELSYRGEGPMMRIWE